HFEICRLLGIRRGLVVINKIDLVDADMLELVQLDVAELVKGSFLEGAPVCAVSATTGRGVAELRQVLGEMAAKVEPKPDRGVFRLPIDRVFTMKGFGTVVAGTVLSGRCKVGDRLELMPQGVEVRVRGIQQHNQAVESAGLGERAALNLQGIERETVERGNVLATPGYYRPTQLINGTLYLLKDAGRSLRNMTRLHLHVGTAEVMCRPVLLDVKELPPGAEALVQLRLEAPVVCDWNDHYVVRLYSPQRTIGGGVVLEASPDRERRFDEAALARLRALKSGEVGSVLEQYLVRHRFDARTLATAAKELALAEVDAQTMLEFLLRTGKARRITHEGRDYLVHEQSWNEAKQAVLNALAAFHRDNPVRFGIKRPELRAKSGTGMAPALYEAVLMALVQAGEIAVEADRVRLAGHEVKLSPAEQREFSRVEALFSEAGLQPPALEEALAGTEKKLAQRVRVALLDSGRLVDIGGDIVLHRAALADAEQRVRRLFESKSELTASEIRQELGTTRKYVIPLLNHFDTVGMTQRRGEVRVLRK
ncbi:MAG: SelB C-terminal domain-containing protein, partial [candidate division WOR-3 bacterium]